MSLLSMSTATAILLAATLAPSAAHASGFLTVKVEAADGAVVCVGDAEDPARFGGAAVVGGRARVLLPRPALGTASPLRVTASDGKKAGQITLDASKPGRRAAVKLGNAEAGSCVPARLVKTGDIPDLMTAFAKRYREQILERADDPLVTKDFFDTFVESGARDLKLRMAEAKGMSVMPDARLSTIVESLAAATSERARQRRRAEIERWAAALRMAARQRQEQRRRLAEAKKEREQAQAEEAAAEDPSQEFCFGGVGQGCGKFQVTPAFSWSLGLQVDFDIRTSTCIPDGTGHSCWVNSGSWTHDECCVDNPNGQVCGGDDSSPACGDEWDRAWRRTASHFTWSDHFNPGPVTTGVVDFKAHCATAGTLIEKPESSPSDNDYGFDDRELCCSKSARDLHWYEAGPLYTQHAVLFYFEPGEVCR